MEIPRDHKTMCKFSSREDGAYLKVVSTCQKLISEQQQESKFASIFEHHTNLC